MFPTMIYDRTSADVSNLEALKAKIKNGTATQAEKNTWSGELKGAVDYFMLNRIGNALNELKIMYPSITYPTTPITNYTTSTKINLAELAKILANIQVIRNISGIPSTTPSVPTTILNITNANNAEEILQVGYNTIINIINSYYYSNDIYSGGGY